MADVVHVTDPSLFPPPHPTSHAVLADGFLLVSGQVPRHPDGGAPDGVEEQVELALANAASVLRAAGMSLEDAIFLRAFVTDRETLAAWRDLRRDRFGDARPAATTVLVAGLADERWRIEIEVVAYRRPAG
ncbi:MAG TPA: RidA family protein [Gaiellaceae bacterium]|nr:RidA family protein [Gaiellaceae bacterium]